MFIQHQCTVREVSCVLQKPNTLRLCGLKQVYVFQRLTRMLQLRTKMQLFLSGMHLPSKQGSSVAWVVLGHQVTLSAADNVI